MWLPADSINWLWDYRNAVYQGGMTNEGRQGFGIVINDGAEVLFGTFCLIKRSGKIMKFRGVSA